MIRLVWLTLLLANLLVFAAWYGLLDPWMPGGAEPERLERQVAAERLRVRPKGASGTAPTPAPAGPSAPAGADVRPDGPNPSAPGSSAGAPAALACLEAGPLDDSRLASVQTWIRGLPDGVQAQLDRRSEPASFMVYVPPSASAAEAQRRVEQLRQARIGDLFVINEGPLRLAISLGVFRSVEGARTHQLALVARGVSDAQVGPGPGAGKAERQWIRVTRTATGGSVDVDALGASLAQVTGVAPVPCSSPAG